jgi:hypothetical protein
LHTPLRKPPLVSLPVKKQLLVQLLLLPLFDYGDAVYGSAGQVGHSKLNKVFNSSIRSITNKRKYDEISETILHLGLLRPTEIQTGGSRSCTVANVLLLPDTPDINWQCCPTLGFGYCILW